MLHLFFLERSVTSLTNRSLYNSLCQFDCGFITLSCFWNTNCSGIILSAVCVEIYLPTLSDASDSVCLISLLTICIVEPNMCVPILVDISNLLLLLAGISPENSDEGSEKGAVC